MRLLLVQNKKVPKECGQKLIEASHDLGIAKTAFQIQATEFLRFNDVFIQFGFFDTFLDYFKAIGKFIDNCGLTNLMVDSEIIASGSVNGFVQGTHFNHSKLLHSFMSLAFQILLFQKFVKNECLNVSDDIILFIKDILNSKPSHKT